MIGVQQPEQPDLDLMPYLSASPAASITGFQRS